jgi:hypothetical protein
MVRDFDVMAVSKIHFNVIFSKIGEAVTPVADRRPLSCSVALSD